MNSLQRAIWKLQAGKWVYVFGTPLLVLPSPPNPYEEFQKHETGK